MVIFHHNKLPQNVGRVLLLNFIMSLILFLIALIYLPNAQPELPLFYTLHDSTDLVVNKWLLLLIPSIILSLSIINAVITFGLNRVLSELIIKLYSLMNLIITLIIGLAMLRIIYVTW